VYKHICLLPSMRLQLSETELEILVLTMKSIIQHKILKWFPFLLFHFCSILECFVSIRTDGAYSGLSCCPIATEPVIGNYLLLCIFCTNQDWNLALPFLAQLRNHRRVVILAPISQEIFYFYWTARTLLMKTSRKLR